ncbi:hypothetical protein [Microbaculum marinum]|uniref:Uncharacterized protein n=1 Tax=Microbaculum marinum TaxID=1764581 RepID=A0AAW9RJR6_9HYPH
MNQQLHTTLHRTAKYFMDSGRARSPEEAMNLLQTFGLTVVVGPEITISRDAQIALLTLVNLARRTFLAGVEVIGLGSAKVIVPLALEPTLAEAVAHLGGRVVDQIRADWPTRHHRLHCPLHDRSSLAADLEGLAGRYRAAPRGLEPWRRPEHAVGARPGSGDLRRRGVLAACR